MLARWVLTKHVYVAPTDAEAEADAEGPEMWYQDSFVRSLRADGIEGLHESVYRESDEMIRRISSTNWPDLLRGPLLIGSPETVAAKVATLAEAGVGELACWMNFGGLPVEKVRRSMHLFANEVMPRFRSARRAAACLEAMLIVDAQVHIWANGPPTVPPHRPVPVFSKDELLAEMDEAGVDAAVLHPPNWDPQGNELAIEAARQHPDRLAILGHFPVDRPASRSLMDTWLSQPGMRGLRFAFLEPAAADVVHGRHPRLAVAGG